MNDAARYRVVLHAALREDAGEILAVLPERAVRLNATAREILDLCDGSRSAGEVAAELRRRHPESPGAGADARTFLAEMLRVGLLEITPPTSPGHHRAARRPGDS